MVKQLVVMRHGEAEMRAASDPDRALTVAGMKQCEASASGLGKQCPVVDVCVVSPYRRAQETARIVNRTIHVREFLDSELITPEADCKIAEAWLFDLFENCNKVMVISHMPFVANLVNLLAGDAEEDVFGFVPAEILLLEFDIFGEKLGSISRPV